MGELPKLYYSSAEMEALGISRRDLQRAWRHPKRDNYAWSSPGGKRITWDLEAFKRYRKEIFR